MLGSYSIWKIWWILKSKSKTWTGAYSNGTYKKNVYCYKIHHSLSVCMPNTYIDQILFNCNIKMRNFFWSFTAGYYIWINILLVNQTLWWFSSLWMKKLLQNIFYYCYVWRMTYRSLRCVFCSHTLQNTTNLLIALLNDVILAVVLRPFDLAGNSFSNTNKSSIFVCHMV